MIDVVWSINIMCAILLVAVGIVIYWIFKYDEWYPNPITTTTDESDHVRDSSSNSKSH